jgi:UDP-N-acetyl-D-glucosamine dehydrogenase
VELAQEINAGMPAYVVRRVQDLLNRAGKPLNGSSLLLLGVTYKPDIADQRESPATPLARQLASYGARVLYHDPYVERWQVPGVEVERVTDLDGGLKEADVSVLLQNHRDYDLDAISAAASCLFDTRGKVGGPAVERL